MKILWISPRWPHPENTGARKATMSLLNCLNEEGIALSSGANFKGTFSFDLIAVKNYFVEQESENAVIESTKPRRYLFVEKKMGFLSFNGLLGKACDLIKYKCLNMFLPMTIAKYYDRSLRSEIAKWSSTETWDYTVLDGLHAAALIDVHDSRYGQLVYRAHNVETDLWVQMARDAKNPLAKVVLKIESLLFARYERFVSNMCKLVFTVSDLDSDRFRSFLQNQSRNTIHKNNPISAGREKVFSLPIGFPVRKKVMPPVLSGSERGTGDHLNLLFVGSLDWLPNQQGLRWFFTEVWPEVVKRRPGAIIQVVGSGNSSWLNKELLGSQAQVFQNVPDLNPYYEQADLTVIPLFFGSGTRVKAIESAAFSRTFLSTQLGAEGLPFLAGEEYIQFDTAADWIRILSEIKFEELQQKGLKLRQSALSKFDQNELTRIFLKELARSIVDTP